MEYESRDMKTAVMQDIISLQERKIIISLISKREWASICLYNKTSTLRQRRNTEEKLQCNHLSLQEELFPMALTKSVIAVFLVLAVISNACMSYVTANCSDKTYFYFSLPLLRHDSYYFLTNIRVLSLFVCAGWGCPTPNVVASLVLHSEQGSPNLHIQPKITQMLAKPIICNVYC